MATLIVFPSLDGQVTSASGAWATARGAASGTTMSEIGNVLPKINAGSDENDYNFTRGFFVFNTSGLGGAVPTAAVFSFYPGVIHDELEEPCALSVVNTTLGSDSALALSDYSLAGTTRYSTDKALSGGGITPSVYNDFTFNAAGIAAVNPSGNTRFAVRIDRDVDNDPPSPFIDIADAYATINSSETVGTSEDPKLTLTYTPLAGGLLKQLQYHGAFI